LTAFIHKMEAFLMSKTYRYWHLISFCFTSNANIRAQLYHCYAALKGSRNPAFLRYVAHLEMNQSLSELVILSKCRKLSGAVKKLE